MFQHKWQGNEYTHPHIENEAQQALHWTRLAAKNDSDSITILVTPHHNWYHNLNSHIGPFLDSRIITHFKVDTITYEEPTIPPKLRINTRIESHAIHILLHHTTAKKTSGTQCKRLVTKDPLNTVEKYVYKYDKRHNLTIIANQTHQLHKWLENNEIDNI